MSPSLLIQAPDPLAPPGRHVTPPSTPALCYCFLYSGIGLELLKAVPGLTSSQQGQGTENWHFSQGQWGLGFPCCSGVPLRRVYFTEGPCGACWALTCQVL